VAILAAGNTMYAISQWLVLVTLARLGTPSDVGRYAFGLALTAPVFLFLNLQLRNLLATDPTKSFLDADYIRLRLMCTALAIGVSASLILALPLDATVTGISLALLAAKSAESGSDLAYGFFQRDRTFSAQALSMALRGLTGAFLFAIAFLLTGSVPMAILALSAVWWLIFFGHDRRLAGRIATGTGIAVGWAAAGRLARLSLAMGFVSMLVSLNANVPRYFIEALLGAEPLGFFAAISYLVVATSLLVSAVSAAVAPTLGEFAAYGRIREFRLLLMRLLGFGFGLGLTIMLLSVVAGEWILTLLYTAPYAAYNHILVILSFAGAFGFGTWFLSTGLTALRSLRIQLPISLAAVLSTALACFLLTSRFGLTGVACAVAIGSVVQFSFAVIAIVRAIRWADRDS
jgi:O-antigen/teichoic acid export membrane protein